MIVTLTGRLARRDAASCVLDVGGVGYLLSMSTSSVSTLPAEGGTVTVSTHLYIRDDTMALFGFASDEEKRLFEVLISVSGVGPKVALAMLSVFSPDGLREAISREDAVLIATTPGVGKKTAQRVIVELKDRLGLPDLAPASAAGAGVLAEAQDALAGMGFTPSETASALEGFDADADASSEAAVRYALKGLGAGSAGKAK